MSWKCFQLRQNHLDKHSQPTVLVVNLEMTQPKQASESPLDEQPYRPLQPTKNQESPKYSKQKTHPHIESSAKYEDVDENTATIAK